MNEGARVLVTSIAEKRLPTVFSAGLKGVVMLFRQFALILLTTMVFPPSGSASDPSQVDSLRSELWRMEYREQQEQSEQNVAAKDKDGDPVVDMDVAGQRVNSDVVSAAVANDSIPVSAPGQAELHELSEETPIADWKVDEGAVATAFVKKEFHEPNAWQLSRINSVAAKAQPLSNGPSMVTFLVAIVACIVVTGALFSGRT